ncbi:MAG: hypothetical protein R3320_09580 [Nitriliruptorales bacterium]|nr:hypothetical protein [Nitriliruptorales bacterium]
MQPPYATGDRIVVDGRPAEVRHVVRTEAGQDSHRCRLLCRWEDTHEPIETPIHCDDDGNGQVIRRTTPT